MIVMYVSLGFSFPADGDIARRSFSIIGMSMSWFAEVSRISPDFFRESNIVATKQCWVLGYSCYLGLASWWKYHYEIKPSDIQCMSLVVIKGNSLWLYHLWNKLSCLLGASKESSASFLCWVSLKKLNWSEGTTSFKEKQKHCLTVREAAPCCYYGSKSER